MSDTLLAPHSSFIPADDTQPQLAKPYLFMPHESTRCLSSLALASPPSPTMSSTVFGRPLVPSKISWKSMRVTLRCRRKKKIPPVTLTVEISYRRKATLRTSPSNGRYTPQHRVPHHSVIKFPLEIRALTDTSSLYSSGRIRLIVL